MKINNRTAIVGGYVRDMLLGISNQDLDLITEHSLEEGLKKITDNFSVEKLNFHPEFKTASIKIKNWPFPLDLVTARKEHYDSPGSLPTVIFPATLEEDLKRRDFSINAMAFEIIGSNFKILDPYNGYNDLQNRVIRVLHDRSFQDDPTRILRGIRFAARLKFKFEKETEKLLIKEIFKNGFSTISNERFWQEIFSILAEQNFLEALKLLRKYRIFKFRKQTEVKLKRAQKFFHLLEGLNLNRSYLILTFLFDGKNGYTSLNISQKFLSTLLWSSKREKEILQSLKKANKNSEIYLLLENLSPYFIFHLLVEAKPKIRRKIKKYLFFLKSLPAIIDGKTLIRQGIVPNESFKNILKKAYLTQLDMKNPTIEKIIKELKLYE
jgi:tRNA nucleotidyltransferase/poly(A) polymerase